MTRSRFMSRAGLFLFLLLGTASLTAPASFAAGSIRNNPANQTVTISSRNMKLVVEYGRGCFIDSLLIGNKEIFKTSDAAYTGMRTNSGLISSRHLDGSPSVEVTGSSARISGIRYGKRGQSVRESWMFALDGNGVVWKIKRELPDTITVAEDAFPGFNLRSIGEFEGALLGNGGVAWFRLFSDSAQAYGVHTNQATFWNPASHECLSLHSQTIGGHGGIRFYSAGENAGCCFSCSPGALTYRYDPGTYRRRFVVGHTDVWQTQIYPAGSYEQVIHISAPSYAQTFDRGTFRGIDGKAVTAILNTVARVGVIDSRLYGGNSWHTPYGPICLHEQYIAQFGIGIDDSNYTNGYKQCLDYYRDHAVEPDGRVKARWAYTNGDASPGSADSLGFYEAQWGMLLDSNPDFVINVADLFNQCGDMMWLRSQKRTCESALNYMLRRDPTHDSLVVMVPRTHMQHRGSDWLDVIWASWKDAFVNAELYHALTLWSGLEELMGDTAMANRYSQFAAGLKRHFNEPISRGGFWDPAHGWYIHWREPDGSVWGDNLVTPVNFMAIDYGICDNLQRKLTILHNIDKEMEKENLFCWPVCLFPYKKGAAGPQNYPFPNYENGDIFLSWGELGVRAYAEEYPGIALRYIKQVIDKYKQDGLAYQRYLRVSQKGAGDDILAGNASAITGLYRDIYGIQPQYNRLYLSPHLVRELYGTKLRYEFQGKEYRISLDGKENIITAGNVSFGSFEAFAVKYTPEGVLWFHRFQSRPSISVATRNGADVKLSILHWQKTRLWSESALNGAADVRHTLIGLEPDKVYAVYEDGRILDAGKTNGDGDFTFSRRIPEGQDILFEVRRYDAPDGILPDKIMSAATPTIEPKDSVVLLPGSARVRIHCASAGSVVRYTLDGTTPSDSSPQYTGPFELSSTATVKARAWCEGLAASDVGQSEVVIIPPDSTGLIEVGTRTIFVHKAFGSTVKLRYPYSKTYPAGGANALTDGLIGGADYQTNWQGFEGNDLLATINLGKEKKIDSISVGFLENMSLWIYYPVKVEISVSRDGRSFIPLRTFTSGNHSYENGSSKRVYAANARGGVYRYVRVHAVNVRTCPPGKPGAGGKAWIFADEIIVR